ncbi:MAG: HDOD domain-containing protein [Thermoguttaceae bacterium]
MTESADATTALNRLVADAAQLFTLPAVAMEVLKLTSQPRVDARAVKACIENDPSLTCKILRIVNSSLFGLSREVSDLNQALALLGSKPLKLLVLGFSLPVGLFEGVTATTLAWYWRRTLTKAVAAREIGRTFRRSGDEPFIVGLLQDLGMLLLIQKVPAYGAFLEQVRARRGDLLALEQQSMGFNHTMLTAGLLTRWMLPQAIVDAVVLSPADAACTSPIEPAQTVAAAGPGCQPAIEGSENDRTRVMPVPQASGPAGLRQVVQWAEAVARLLVDGHCQSLEVLQTAGGKEGGFSGADLEAMVAAIEDQVRQLADVLSLPLAVGQDYRDVLVQAHAQLSVEATAAAAVMLSGRENEQDARVEREIWAEELRTLSAEVARCASGPRKPAACPRSDESSRKVPDPHPVKRIEAAATKAVPGLPSLLATTVCACRRSRQPLTLLRVEFGRGDARVGTAGTQERESRQIVERVCEGLTPRPTICGDDRLGFTLLLPGCERSAGIELGNAMIHQAHRPEPRNGSLDSSGLAVAIGVASIPLPPRNFPAQELLTAADRCLYASRSCGGGVVKSIEIY